MNEMPCRIGVIGAGGIASNIHLPVLTSVKGVKVAAICDLKPERVMKAAGRFGIPSTYFSYYEMLEKETIDAVFILVQPDALFRIAIDCLKRGLHVFMEKPMGITLFQAQAIAETARSMNRTVHVGFNRRYIPLVTETLRRIREITTINFVRGCFYKNSSPSFYDGAAGAFECDVIHVIDLVRFIAESSPARTSSFQVCPAGNSVPHLWMSSVVFENGVAGSIQANYQSAGRVHQFEIHGQQASAYIDLGFGKPACHAQILYSQGKGNFSISAAGIDPMKSMRLDGMEIAQSTLYERYYGYYDEDVNFISAITQNPDSTDLPRLAEDLASMKFLNKLQESTEPIFT